MKLGIVLVCIAAGVLLVSNVYARGDDGQGNIAGPGRQVLGRKLKSLMEDGLKQIAGSSPERKLLQGGGNSGHSHSGDNHGHGSGHGNSGYSGGHDHGHSGHSGHSSGYSSSNSGQSHSGHSGEHSGGGHAGGHSDKNYG